MENEEIKFIDSIFSYLLDSYSYTVLRDRKADQIKELSDTLASSKTATDELLSDINLKLEEYARNRSSFEEYKIQAMKCIEPVLNQYFSKDSSKILAEISGLNAGIENDNANSTKLAFQFLLSVPLSILNREIIIKNVDKNITITENIKSSFNTDYAFQLGKGNSEFMSNPYFSSIYSGMRIPVEKLENSEQGYRYESLDAFSLISAKLSGSKLVSIFASDPGNSVFEFAYDNNDHSISILYTYNGKQNNLSIDSNVSPVLNGAELVDSLSKLFEIVNALAGDKIKLTALNVDGDDLLSTANYSKLFYKIIGSAYVKNLVNALPDTSDGSSGISKDLIKKRIYTIGKDEKYIESLLFG
ncbi:MAG: hypothetical protein QXZ44_03935 [Ferroplasma sp.]